MLFIIKLSRLLTSLLRWTSPWIEGWRDFSCWTGFTVIIGWDGEMLLAGLEVFWSDLGRLGDGSLDLTTCSFFCSSLWCLGVTTMFLRSMSTYLRFPLGGFGILADISYSSYNSSLGSPIISSSGCFLSSFLLLLWLIVNTMNYEN